MKRMQNGWFGTSVLGVCALLSPSTYAADVLWDGGGGDGYWTNALNWSSNTVPSTTDRAMVGLAGLPPDKRIRLGSSQTIGTLAINGDANNVIIGDRGDGFSLTLLTGNVNGTNGTIKGVIAANIILGTNGTWNAPGSWQSTIFCYGDVTDGGNGYGVTFPDDQNKIAVLGGRWTLGGALTIRNNTTRLGGVYTNESGIVYYGGSITNAVGVYGDCRLAFSDGADSTFILDNAYAADSDRIQGSTRLGTVRNGGAFQLAGNVAAAVSERVATLDLQSGRMQLTIAGTTNKTVATDLIFTSVSRASGTALLVTTNYAGRLFVDGAVNTNNTWQPWCFFGDYYSKVRADQAIVSTVAADYTTLAATGNSATGLHRFSAASLALGENSAVWGLWCDGSTPQTLDLGPYDLTVGSGAISLGAGTNKTITSSGGRLVFGGEDVILNINGTGTCTLSAPMAWSKPAGSSMVRPSLVFPRGNRSTGGIVLDGEDRIGNYDTLSVYNASRPTLVFAGPSNRTFYGPVNGLVNLEKRGSGTLTFAGPNQRRTGTLVVTEGRVVMAHATAPTPTVTNAVCEVAAGITFAAAPAMGPGSTYAGLGTFGNTINPLATHRIAPGTPTVAGCLTFGNQFAPAGNLGFDIKLDVATNDNVRVVNTFTKPPTGSTFTFRVTDLSNGAAVVKDRSFVVLRYVGTLALSGNTLNLVVENGSPTRLDTTTAVAMLDTTAKTITISGLRSVPNGTVVLLR